MSDISTAIERIEAWIAILRGVQPDGIRVSAEAAEQLADILTTRLAPDRTAFADWLKTYVGKQDATKMRFSVAELEIAFNAALTPATAPDREAIAKIIDPNAWDNPIRMALHREQQEAALTKADAILSLMGEG